MREPLLELHAVDRTFGTEPCVHALREVNLCVCAGESVAIIGRSGSGKSTLLNVVGLLDSPTSGTYRVAGLPVEGLSERTKTSLRAIFFGFVFQQSFLLMSRTALENVEIPLRLQGVRPPDRQRRAAAALDAVGLSRRSDFLPRMLSGGECQRVAIARALVHEPQVLLCDEPTGNLDEQTAREVLGTLLAANKTGTTLVMVTHDLAIAGSFPRVISARDGQLTEGPDSFLKSEAVFANETASQQDRTG